MQTGQKDKVESTNKGGAPVGNKNAAKARQMTAMLAAALKQDNKQRLRKGVEHIADSFARGEVWAIQTVFDRIEGKPTQVVAGDPESPLITSLTIEFVGDE